MPHDFDVVRAERENADRKIIIGGEELEFRPYIYPEHIVKLQEALTDPEYLELVDRVVTEHLLEPGQQDKWKRARSPENPKPLSLYDMTQMINYVLAVASGRPTVPSSVFSISRSENGTGLTEPSPSLEPIPSVA